MVVGCPLGPKGSRWAVDLWWGKGADYGDIDFEWQTTSVDVPGSTSEYVAEPVTSNPWYKSDMTKTLVTGYNAVTINTSDTQLGGIIPNGADGTMLSADGTASAFTYRYMNGGGDASVWWWLRLKSTTKNAASTGYRMRIHGLRIRRTIESGYSPF
jgi:hypothetical protein